MQDISTSFCFICLLHLANERGLKLEVGESPGAEDEGKPEEGDNKVGDLWGLRVFFFLPFCASYLSGTDCHFSLRSSEIQPSSPQREGGAGDYRRVNALGLYTQTYLHVFYRFVRFFILPVVIFPCLLSATYCVVVYLPPASLRQGSLLGFSFRARLELRVSKSRQRMEVV